MIAATSMELLTVNVPGAEPSGYGPRSSKVTFDGTHFPVNRRPYGHKQATRVYRPWATADRITGLDELRIDRRLA